VAGGSWGELKAELLRKSIHMLIALVPALAAIDRPHTVLLLMGATLFYTCAESLRFLGFKAPFVSAVTAAVLRRYEQGRFALSPVTLGLGALLTLLIFPPLPAAAAIYALAFGDSASALIGRFLGRLRPAFLSGKSIEGVMACFCAAAICGYLVFRDWRAGLAIGFASLVVDILPIGDYDNLLLPTAAGFASLVFMMLS